MSCSPVTSGAPSHTTRSARPPLKWLIISVAVDSWKEVPVYVCVKGSDVKGSVSGNLGDVSVYLSHAAERRHQLQIHGNNLDISVLLWPA